MVNALQAIATLGNFLAAVVTAVATFFLWRVTKLLAVETKRMADASAQPQVVASIVPNQWATNHLDIRIENTGNATAFDINVNFEPPLTNDESRKERGIPFQRISLLKPSQSLLSYLSGVGSYLDKSFMVDVTWRLAPGGKLQRLSYTLDMTTLKDVSFLGARDPIVQIAEQIKSLREDWRNVAGGSRNIGVDVFVEADRAAERAELDRRYNRDAGQPTPEPAVQQPMSLSRIERLKRLLTSWKENARTPKY